MVAFAYQSSTSSSSAGAAGGLAASSAFGAGGASGTGGMIIWPLFGATNQILAGMTLLVISVMLIKLGRPSYYTMVPMLFVFTMSFLAACVTLAQFYQDGNYLLVVLDLVVLGTSLMVMLEAASVIAAFKRGGGNVPEAER